MSLQYYVVDAFTTELYRGNQAAVVIFPVGDERSKSDSFQLNVAQEFGYSETAFLQRLPSTIRSQPPRFSLRWFTPVTEFPLCGHATLASASVLFKSSQLLLDEKWDLIEFETLSGALTAKLLEDGRIELNFPADRTVLEVEVNAEVDSIIRKALSKAAPTLKNSVRGIRSGRLGYLIILNHHIGLEGLAMDMTAFREIGLDGMFVFTQQLDFNRPFEISSRVFDPVEASMEDSVTGSAHCMIAPFWIDNLHYLTSTIQARQVSTRGGILEVVWLQEEDRILLRGNCVMSMSGTLHQ